MKGEIRIAGGLCAPLDSRFELLPQLDDIWPNDVVNVKGRIRRFVAWDKGWGLHLRGGPLVHVPLMDLMPVIRVQRGGIRFLTP